MVANMGDDSIAAYGSETYREVFRIKLTPAGTKLMSTNHFARGRWWGPDFCVKEKPQTSSLQLIYTMTAFL